MPKLNVLHVITEQDWEIAGAEVIALFDDGNYRFNIMAIVPAGSGATQILHRRGIPVGTFDASGTEKDKIKALTKTIKKIRPGVIHTHTSHYAKIAAHKSGVAVRVHTQHSIIPLTFSDRWSINSLSTFVISTTESIKKYLISNGLKPNKTKVVYHGVPQATESIAEKQQLAREQLNIPQDAFVVVSFESLTPDYNYVLNTIKEMPYNVVFILAGHDGGYRDTLIKRIEKEKMQNVRVLVNVLDIIDILSIADVQLNVTETLGIAQASLFLGMSLGKPIITTDIEISKLIKPENSNILDIPPNDIAALDDAITKLKDDIKLYDSLAKNTKAHYRKTFTAELMAKEIVRIYKGLV